MKNLLSITLMVSVVFLASTAFAERGHGRGGGDYYASQGSRIERHMDRQGDRIEHRFEHKAIRAEAKGHYKQAKHFRTKGKQINRHLDHKGDRIHARYDRRHTYRHRVVSDHRYYSPQPRVVYRSHSPYNSYFGLAINQPGLWLGWGLYK